MNPLTWSPCVDKKLRQSYLEDWVKNKVYLRAVNTVCSVGEKVERVNCRIAYFHANAV